MPPTKILGQKTFLRWLVIKEVGAYPIIGDSSGGVSYGLTQRALKVSGMEEVAQRTGAQLSNSDLADVIKISDSRKFFSGSLSARLRNVSYKGLLTMDLNIIKILLTDTTPWVKLSDIRVNVLEERHAKLTLPVKEKHLNHVGTVYAGSHFMLMEVAGAALFAATYGIEKFIPINKGMEIKFLKSATTDITCDLKISKEEAYSKIKTVEEIGMGDWVLNIETIDERGITVSTSVCNYYIIPKPKF